jgi:hypothetical protein
VRPHRHAGDHIHGQIIVGSLITGITAYGAASLIRFAA